MCYDDVLEEYAESIRCLKTQCLEGGLSEQEFRKLYFESIDSFEKSNEPLAQNRTMLPTKKIFFIFIIAAVSSIIIYNYNIIYSYIACNIQEYIYPSLRLLRKLSIPFISLFPSLTELYYDTCLVHNPFFTVTDMDCWPCSTINSVRQIHSPQKPINTQYIAPFIYETDQDSINMDQLRDIYLKNKDTFDKESSKITIADSKYHISPEELFKNKKLDNEVYTWKFNNMALARVLRADIPRPKVVPRFGQSTERFILIDNSQKRYKIPDTECNFSFLLSLSGSRTINLLPAEECKLQCKSLEVELQESFLLWYNWWYWRPVINSSSSNTTFIAHIGSYC